MAFTALAVRVYKDPVTVQWAEGIRENFNEIHDHMAIHAWVRFNGAGSPAVDDGNNVSSITDSGAGQYLINFTTGFASANYCMAGSAQRSAGTNEVTVCFDNGVAPAVGSCEINVLSDSSLVDNTAVCVMFIGTKG